MISQRDKASIGRMNPFLKENSLNHFNFHKRFKSSAILSTHLHQSKYIQTPEIQRNTYHIPLKKYSQERQEMCNRFYIRPLPLAIM